MTGTIDSSAPIPVGPLLLYDGECGLCDKTVRFIIRHDSKATVKFAALQSDLAKQLLTDSGLDPDYLKSVVLFDKGRLFTGSDAALQTARYLDRPWRWSAAARIVPRFIRNPVYKLIAKYRYKMFGKVDACQLPAPGERERFVD